MRVLDVETAVRLACQMEMADREHAAFAPAPRAVTMDAQSPTICQTAAVMRILEMGAIIQGGGGYHVRDDEPADWAMRLMDGLAAIARTPGVDERAVGLVIFHGRRGSRPDTDWPIEPDNRAARRAAFYEYQLWWLTLTALVEVADDLPGVRLKDPEAPHPDKVAKLLAC